MEIDIDGTSKSIINAIISEFDEEEIVRIIRSQIYEAVSGSVCTWLQEHQDEINQKVTVQINQCYSSEELAKRVVAGIHAQFWVKF